jgi:hypothetical protein
VPVFPRTLGAEAIERALGAPIPIVPIEPVPANALELGLVDIEEDVLRDEYELARATFSQRLCAWRLSRDDRFFESACQRYFDAARIVCVHWDDLAALTDAEIDYAFRLTRSVGGTTVGTRGTTAGPSRLAPFEHRHGLTVRFTDDSGPV